MPRGSNKGGTLSEEAALEILEAYRNGGFIRDICRRTGHGIDKVREILDAAGLRGGVPIEEAGL